MEHIPVKISYAGEGRQTLSWSLLLLELKRFPPHCHQVLTHVDLFYSLALSKSV